MRSLRLVIGSSGAVAEARIGLTHTQRRLLMEAGRPPCPAQAVLLVVDTGASHSFVDESVMRTLGLLPSNRYRFHSASTRGVADQCMAYNVDLQRNRLDPSPSPT